MDCSTSAIYGNKIRAVIILFFIFFCDSGDVDSDKHVLLEVKRLLTDPFRLLSAWNDDIDHCRWPGITCSSNSRVTGLRIPRSSRNVYVAGQFPSAISQLHQLRFLSLRFNRLSGIIPPGVWRMEKLEVLDLQGNFLTGSLPATFAGLPSLRVLDLGENNLHGEVPESLSNCSFLEILNLSFNQFTGRLPPQIGNRCGKLVHLDLSGNLLVGAIPRSFGNLTHLRSLILHSNLFSETIPTNLGFLENLEVLDVSKNSLSGPIPLQLRNCTNLSIIVLSSQFISRTRIGNFSGEEDYNYFQGGISMEIWSIPKLRLLWAPRASLEGKFPSISGECESLEMINLGQNFFTGEIPNWFSKCRRLHFLDLSTNMLTGELKPELRVPCMKFFDVSNNLLSGRIPRFLPTVCKSVSKSKTDSSNYITKFSHLNEHDGMLVIHNFSRNNFHGGIDSLPISSGDMVSLSYMFIAGRNKINSSFSETFFEKCDGLYAVYIDLSNNLISDQVPETIDSLCRSLRKLDVSSNQISGFIASNLSRLVYLVSLNLSWNNLEGEIPASLGEIKDLKILSLSGNKLNGSIPAKLGQMKSLQVLELSSNSLSGEIPNEMLNLTNLTAFLVDNNKLSGRIPSFRALEIFNASFNNLSGPLPSVVKCSSLLGNPLLCRTEETSSSSGVSGHGGNNDNSNSNSNSSPPVLNSIEVASIASSSAIVAVLISLVGVLVCTRRWKPRMTVRRRKKEVIVFTDIGVGLTFEKVVEATGSFSGSNCIGNGGFGATYKAEISISPPILVAVKRLAIGRFQGVQQFHAEIKTLARLRHPNLVTLVGYHASETEMFLIYNYLPGGNLEKFIHERSAREWRVLHKISLDIASALAYLHDQCVPRVVHRDVKPSNILLDNEFNAYLSDFGLARLLESSETHATTGVAGTFGYVAPEYAMTCRVSDKADVYSFGVVLMELFSDKKALDPSFSSYGNGFNIVAWASLLLRHGRPMEFFTASLWSQGVHDGLVEMLRLAVLCTVDSLPSRPAMKQVVRRLKQLRPPT